MLFNTLFAKDLKKVTLQLQWKHQFEFAGFYIAKEKGYFKNIGLDVDLKEYDSSINIIEEVLNNEDMYGITYSNLFLEYLKNKPLIFMANFFKQSPLVLVTQPNITFPSDLKNKKIMGLDNNIHSAIIIKVYEEKNIIIFVYYITNYVVSPRVCFS